MRPGFAVLGSGTVRPAVPGERRIGSVTPDERVQVTVVFRHATPPEPPALPGRSLPREVFAARHGAHDDDVRQVSLFAQAQGLDVVSVDQARRAAVLEGSVAALTDAFDTTLALVEIGGKAYRARTGPLHVPASLAPVIEGVFGLDTRPVAQPRSVVAQPEDVVGSYATPDLARLYGFPQGFDGSGQTIAIIELGGGFTTGDLDAYFSGLGLATPTVEAVSIDAGANAPDGDPGGADGEVMLDIEVAGSIAPGASVLVYFAPNTNQGFLDAVSTAILAANRPACVSISWGGPEASQDRSFMTTMDGYFGDAAALGITVCVAAGDNGSSDGLGDGRQHADFPASSPHALACGGTILDSGDGTRIDSEVVWNDDTGTTGGGISDVFPVPAWQSGTSVPASVNPGGFSGRGLPDVAADASPRTGYKVRVDGTDQVIGGTSAVAPLWAGLIALMIQYLGEGGTGFLNLALYSDTSAQQTFNDITVGNNGAYEAGPGWDPCTGWGSPHGDRLLQILGTWVHAQTQPGPT
jgi:kumamolisin